MNVYRLRSLSVIEQARPVYVATLAEAHAAAKLHTFRDETRIDLIEVFTDKVSIVAHLNGTGLFLTQREWKLSPRGGLIEVEVGTDRPLKGIL